MLQAGRSDQAGSGTSANVSIGAYTAWANLDGGSGAASSALWRVANLRSALARDHRRASSKTWASARSSAAFGSRMGATKLGQAASDAVIGTLRRLLTCANAVTWAVWPVAHRVRI